MRKIKRALTGILAATMVMASVFTVCASTGSGGGGAGTSSSEEVVPEEVVVTNNSSSSNSSSDSDSSSSSSASSTAAQTVKSAGAVMSVGGTSVKTTIAGSYAAKGVSGIAVTSPVADLRAALGLTSGQTPYVIIYDIDAKTSSKAMASINAAAQALGANVIASMNMELGARQGGKFTPVTLKNGAIGMVVGIPAKAVDPTKTYSMVCVQPGGAVTILEDLDTNPMTVTFEAKASLAAYSIVAK